MTDPLAGQDPEDDASAETPAAPALDIEKLKADIMAQAKAEFDQRAAGFQRALNDKEAALRAAQEKARELEMSGMSQDERDALEWQQLQDAKAALERENALLRLGQEYPDELPVFQKILDAKDPKEQLNLIRELRAAAKAAAPSNQANPAEGEPDVPDVDPNNPAGRLPVGDGATFNGTPINDDWADRILSSVPRFRS